MNLNFAQGTLGLCTNESAWLTAAYFMTNVPANLLPCSGCSRFCTHGDCHRLQDYVRGRCTQIARRDVAIVALIYADSLRLATSRDSAEYSTKLELRQAEAAYDSAAQIVVQIESAIVRTEDSLSQLVGDVPGVIHESQRLYRWPLGRRPDDHASLSDLGL